MTEATALAILYLITALGVVAWLVGARFLVRSFRTVRPAQETLGEGERPPANWIVGAAVVDGRPEALSAKAASLLIRPGRCFGTLKILSRTDETIAFESAGSGGEGSSPQAFVRRGQIRFEPISATQTRIDYGIEIPSGRGLWIAGTAFAVVGLLALAVGFWLIRTYVVPHANLAVRGQTLQMLQVVHFLWPPFLFGGIQRMRRRMVRGEFDALVHNLPFIESTPS